MSYLSPTYFIRLVGYLVIMTTASQIRAARAFVRWSAEKSAEPSDRSWTAIQRLESAQRLESVAGVPSSDVRTLETAGVIFICANEHGPGVRRFPSANRMAGAGRGVSIGDWAVGSTATIPDDRHQVPPRLVQAIVRLDVSSPHDDAVHAYPNVLGRLRPGCSPRGRSPWRGRADFQLRERDAASYRAAYRVV